MCRTVEGFGKRPSAIILEALKAREDAGRPFFGCDILVEFPDGEVVTRVFDSDTGDSVMGAEPRKPVHRGVTMNGWPCTVEFYDEGPDEKGRRSFSISWNDGVRNRGQHFFAAPENFFTLEQEMVDP